VMPEQEIVAACVVRVARAPLPREPFSTQQASGQQCPLHTAVEFRFLLDAEKTGEGLLRLEFPARQLACQNCSAIYVENFASDKAGVLATQKQHGGRNFLRLAHSAQRNGAPNFFPASGIVQSGS